MWRIAQGRKELASSHWQSGHLRWGLDYFMNKDGISSLNLTQFIHYRFNPSCQLWKRGWWVAFKSGVGINPRPSARGGSWGRDKWLWVEGGGEGRGPKHFHRQEYIQELGKLQQCPESWVLALCRYLVSLLNFDSLRQPAPIWLIYSLLSQFKMYACYLQQHKSYTIQYLLHFQNQYNN